MKLFVVVLFLLEVGLGFVEFADSVFFGSGCFGCVLRGVVLTVFIDWLLFELGSDLQHTSDVFSNFILKFVERIIPMRQISFSSISRHQFLPFKQTLIKHFLPIKIKKVSIFAEIFNTIL